MSLETREPIDAGTAIKHGLIGGIVGAILMLMAEMIIAALMGMSAFMPPQMIAAIVLGPAGAGLEPMAPATIGVLTVGMVVHMVLSMMFGAVFGLGALAIPSLRSSVGALTVVGVVFGIVLWLVNFYVIAAVAFPWFLMASPIQQAISHGLFGLGLGYYLGTKLAPSTDMA